VTFESHSEKVRVIATFLPASRQILDDFVELRGFLETSLPYYVNLEEETQLLSGDGTGENLNGIIPQSTPFDTGLLIAADGWNKIDVIGRAIQQITAAKEIDPTFVIVHPNDWWGMRLAKDGFGRYLISSDPQSVARPSLFGLEVVYTTSMAPGTFLVGSGNAEAAEIRDRMQTIVEISTEDSDNFRKNLVTVRCEKRIAFICKRPRAFVSGSFSTSPA
jgi:HK97 family phage major capsid protein